MKKIIFSICLLLLAAFTVFAQAGQAGVIREMTGEVELKKAGESAFSPAAAGSQIAPNTIVSTGFRSTAIIAVGSSLITVRPLTRLTFAEIQSAANSENVNLNLQTGRVRVEVKPPAGTKTTFSVQSPSATASVRGTSFEFDTVNLSVQEGTVVFGGKSGPVTLVSAGSETYVQKDGTAADPIEVTAASLLPPSPIGSPETSAPTGVPSSAPESELSVDVNYN